MFKECTCQKKKNIAETPISHKMIKKIFMLDTSSVYSCRKTKKIEDDKEFCFVLLDEELPFLAGCFCCVSSILSNQDGKVEHMKLIELPIYDI